MDSSLARLSNFSLASQASSLSSRSSAKYSDRNAATPRSSQHSWPNKEGNSKFPANKVFDKLRMEFSELSDRELTDSDCSSLHSSLKIRLAVAATAGGSKEYSVISEEQSSYTHSPHKKTTECCSIM